ncbi:MAG: hypothetical protein IH994_01105 [Proteobacteria bacterium]|nr:hypothetical protein [Pseudomonadota bacterium]
MENFRSQFTEARNRARLDDLMLGKGFVPYHPSLDTGVDVIYYREDGDKILKVQLKSRVTIDKKYIGRGIVVAFPTDTDWCIYDHDALVNHAVGDHIKPSTLSWSIKGSWTWSTTPAWMHQYFEANNLASTL